MVDSFQLSGRMALPFTPLSVVFQGVQYYVDTPLVIAYPFLSYYGLNGCRFSYLH